MMTRAQVLIRAARDASKECRRCKRVVPLSEYHASPTAKDGRHSWCKKCYSTWRMACRDKKRGGPPVIAPRRPFIAIPGERVGRWTVLAQGRAKGSRHYFLCRCECGTEREVSASNLRQGLSLSCGCLIKDAHRERYTKSNNESAVRRIFNTYRAAAKDRGYVWDLTFEQVGQLVRQPCVYCGATESNRYGLRGKPFFHNGIDRADNNQGYTQANSVPCCGPCNRAKLTMSREQFIALACRIAAKHGGRP